MTNKINCIKFVLTGDEGRLPSQAFLVPISLLIRMDDKDVLSFGSYIFDEGVEPLVPYGTVEIHAKERKHELALDDFYGMCIDGTLIDHIKKMMGNTVPELNKYRRSDLSLNKKITKRELLHCINELF